ncbi:hypothetical protein MJT46_004043 [Ovis ammon polii x Ovis aries]|nr:hypothetical protein MJT46_004043 [Ovis ammon polii x Ovis aries]
MGDLSSLTSDRTHTPCTEGEILTTGQPGKSLPISSYAEVDVPQLLHKFVVIVGDSVQRAVYEDLVLPLQKDCLPSSSQLKTKGELSFEHHTLLEGCRQEGLHCCTRYREMRPFCVGHHLVLVYFLAHPLRLADTWAMDLPAATTRAGGSGMAPPGEFRALWAKAAPRLWT